MTDEERRINAERFKDYWVFNNNTLELEPYLEVARSDPNFDPADRLLFDKNMNKYVGERLQAVQGNRGGGGLFGAISNAVTNVLQPVEQTISTNLAQLDKDLSLSQNAPLIATIAASIALPGVGASIGNSLLSAGLLPVGTSVATATAVGSGLANAALQVAQGKSVEDALKAGVVGAAGGAVGNYLVGDAGTVKNFVTSTSTNLLAGKNPEDAVKAGIISSSAGFAGGAATQATDSAIAGQVTAGTTAGLLSGKTGEQALLQGVGSINVGSIIPDTGIAKAVDTTNFLGQLNQLRDIVGLAPYQSINDYYRENGITPPEVTVPTEAQATSAQQDLQTQLAPYEAVTTPAQPPAQPVIDLSTVIATPAQPPVTIEPPAVVQPPVSVEPTVVSQEELKGTVSPFETTAPVDTTTSGFDTKDIIDDNSGFTISQPTIPEVVTQTTTTDITQPENVDQISTTPTTENTGGNMATSYTEDPYGFTGGSEVDMAGSYADSNTADPYALLDPVTGEYFVGADDQNYDPYTATVSDAIQDYAKGTGLSVKDVVKFFKDNPNLAKSATSLIAGGVGLFGTKLSTEAATAAAKAAADAMKFKPVGVTTRFGTTDYKYDADNNLVSAGYTLTPDLKAIQDKLMSGATLSLDEAKKVADLYDPLKKASASLFDLGTSYLAKTPEQVAADYMAKQQDLLAPSRERQMSQLQNTLFQQGRGGLSVGATSARPSGARGLGATTPEMEAYYNALAQQDAALAAGAQQAGQQSVLFGKGLLGAGGEFLGKYTAGQTSAYDPFKSLLSTAGAVESMGAGALDVGTALGGRTTTASSNAARTLLPTASVNPYSSLFTSLADDPQFKAAVQSFLTGG